MQAMLTGTVCRAAAAGVPFLVSLSLAGSAVAQLQWVQRQVFGRFNAPIAYDSNRARTVLFAGGYEQPQRPETWEWDGSAWQLRTPAQLPPLMFSPALAHDSLRGRTVLFDGETWEWDGTTWTRMQPASGGSGSFAYARMAFDSLRGRVVMFGGSLTTFVNGFFVTTFPNGTGEWDGVQWVGRAPAVSPPGRSQPGMAFDQVRGRVVMFGGSDASLRNDTWEWDGVNWVQLSPPLRPSPRAAPLAFDSSRGRTVLFGGAGQGNLGDTWEWNGITWLATAPTVSPPARSGHGMAYDSVRGHVLLVGGSNSTGPLGDTWSWDGAQWTRLAGASSPSPRSGAAATWDSSRSVLLLFGGSGVNAYRGDTWQWDGQGWLELLPPTQPTPRWRAAMAYDSVRGRAVLFGGQNSGGYLNDTWEWDGANWQLAATSGPSPRIDSAMTFDSIRGNTLLFGGQSAAGLLGETWVWDGVAWQHRTLAAEPTPRALPGMACDERRGVVVLNGGFNGNFETWEWNGAAWLQRTPAHAPNEGQMAWDAARARVVLSGRTGAFNGSIVVWEWDGIDWQRRPITPAPFGERFYYSFTYDRVRECDVLLGGQASNGRFFQDLWELAPVHPASVTPFGSGCAGTLGPPVLGFVDGARAWLGDTVTLRVAPIPAGTEVWLALGSSNTQWGGITLPAPLDGIGMPGCTQYVGVDDAFQFVDSGNTALLTATVPTNPALLGVTLYLQGAVIDPFANQLGLVLSNALAAVVGAR